MQQWTNELYETLTKGTKKSDRTGTGTTSRFGVVTRYRLNVNAFPMVTTKFTSFHSIKHELLWMLRGDTDVKYLIDNRVSIWNEWIKPETAVVRMATIEEAVKLTVQTYGSAIDGVVEKAISVFTERFGKKPLFVTGGADSSGSDDRIQIELPRATGNGVQDAASILTVLLNKLVEFHHDDDYEYYDTLADVLGLHNYDCEENWKKVIHDHGCDHGMCGSSWPCTILSGDLGPVYGKQLVRWQPGIDPEKLQDVIDSLPSSRYDEIPEIIRSLTPKPINQIDKVIDLLKNDPDSRRIFISMWNVGELDDMALMPCHLAVQFYSREMTPTGRFNAFLASKHAVGLDVNNMTVEDFIKAMDEVNFPTRTLSSLLLMRSNDAGLGAPYNITCYSLLTAMIAQVTNHELEEFIHVRGDHHIYSNHQDMVKEVIARQPKALPKLKLNPEIMDIFAFTGDDIQLEGYEYHPAIKAPVAV